MGTSFPSEVAPLRASLARMFGGTADGESVSVALPKKQLRAILLPLARKVKVGIPTATALEALAESTPDKNVQALCESVSRRLRSGASEAEAFADHPKTFTPTMIAEITTAAAQGDLAAAFETIAKTLQQEAIISGKFLRMSIYPVGTMLLMLCSFLLSLVSLIPKLETVFEMVPFEDLPLHTRIMVTASRIFRVHPGAYTVAIFGSMFGFVLWARTYEGRAFLFRIIQLLPFVRSVIDQQVRARFLRDLARLQRETGRGMIELACAAIPFPPLAERLGRVGDRLDQGTPLSVALDESGFFSANTLSYIEGGESSGRLEEMLVAAAEEETDNANERVDLLAAAIEPASIVVVGVFVSLLLTSVYGGIFAMQKVMRDRARTSDLPSFYTHPCSSDNATCPAIRYVTSALPGRTTT